MSEILQDRIPEEMTGPVRLPGVGPCAPQDWLRVDEAYAPQMVYRRRLLRAQLDAVHALQREASPAAMELMSEALALLPGLGFEVSGEHVVCPDGVQVRIDRNAPLVTLGGLVQEDLCILEKQGAEHVLTGAVLCFPASWRLSDKIGRPLVDIHAPIAPYDADLARRVQRLFDGVRPGRPLWRFNRLRYAEAELFQPQRKDEEAPAPYIRSERQCILRLPQTEAVVFSIHTYIVRQDQGPGEP